ESRGRRIGDRRRPRSPTNVRPNSLHVARIRASRRRSLAKERLEIEAHAPRGRGHRDRRARRARGHVVAPRRSAMSALSRCHPGMAIETLLHTERSLAAATRMVLDKLLSNGFENIDPPEDGRVEIDCLDGDSGEEWGFVAPEVGAMDAFAKIKEKTTTVRVS